MKAVQNQEIQRKYRIEVTENCQRSLLNNLLKINEKWEKMEEIIRNITKK